MTGEGFSASILPSPGLKGDASSFKPPVSQKIPQPVHQGFTQQSSQSRLQSVYIMAIRDMMEQGFHQFVGIEQNQQTKDFPWGVPGRQGTSQSPAPDFTTGSAETVAE